jgi:AbrB family looped-hinge helix DNA binding protein
MNMKCIIGERGQVVIPKQIRNKLNLEKGTILEIETADNNTSIILRPIRRKKKDWREWIGALKGEELIQEYLKDKKKEMEKESKWKK